MAYLDHPDSSLEREPERHNHLRVFDEFASRFGAPEEAVRFADQGESGPAYDHVDFYGTVHFNEDDRPDFQVAIFESTEVVRRQREQLASLPYSGAQMAVDPDGYFMATTDGFTITEWRATKASWKVDRPYWITHVTPDPDTLTLVFKACDDSAPRITIAFRRDGGVIRRPGDQAVGWMVGEGTYIDGPHLLDDPQESLAWL